MVGHLALSRATRSVPHVREQRRTRPDAGVRSRARATAAGAPRRARRTRTGARVTIAVPVPDSTWIDVCGLDDLVPGRGVAALVGGEQIAVFLLADGSVVAVDNLDPFSGANVLARGIVGSSGDVVTLASP